MSAEDLPGPVLDALARHEAAADARLSETIRRYLALDPGPDPVTLRLVTAEGPLEHGPGHRAGREITFTITDEIALVRDPVAVPARPYCAACRKPIHADETSPTGYVHAGTLRVACSTGGGQAHPAT